MAAVTFSERLRVASSHYTGTAIEPLLKTAADRVEATGEENERLRGLVEFARDVLAGDTALTSTEHGLFLELLTMAVDDRLDSHPLYGDKPCH